MPLFAKKTEAYLGIDIGAGGMKLVELHKTKNRPQLWTYGFMNEPLDIHMAGKAPVETQEAGEASLPVTDERVEKYAAYLKELVKKSRATTKYATASLPVSYVFHAVITLPLVPEKELDYHVRAKVEKMLPFPIDEMQVVHQKVGDEKANAAKKFLTILVTAVPKNIIEFYTAIFQKAGLFLEELETEAFALERSLVGRDPATSMVIDIGAERTNFFIVDNGVPITHRSIQMGGKNMDILLQNVLGMEPQIVSQMKKDMSHLVPSDMPDELFLSAVDPILKEIQYSFDLFLHQTGNENKRPEKIILTGGASLFPPFVASIARKFPMKVFVGDPWARVVYQQGLKPVLDGVGPRMAVSIGLALRNILVEEQPQV